MSQTLDRLDAPPADLPLEEWDAPSTGFRSETSFTETSGWVQELCVWGGSFGLHCLILVVCSLVYLTIENQQPDNVLNSEMTEWDQESVLPELTQELDTWDVSPDAPVTFTPTKTVAETVQNIEPSEEVLSELAIDETAKDPLAFGPENMDVDEVIAGIEGTVVNTEGDTGSVDRITVEIIQQLKQSKVLVAWLMDASGSLSTRREQVIGRFDRVYKELDELADDRAKALLTHVVSFGEQVVPMTPQPTADREAIKKAVRDIKTDESGVENVFTAIKKTVLDCRKFRSKGYKVMIVVLTDESGDDLALLEESIKQVKRYKMPVYVMGPLAPFAREEIDIKWVDRNTKEVLFLPVDRGPESVQIEYPTLPHWQKDLRNGLMSSGFGPYALARITSESGGIYFLYDDGSIPGPSFNVADLLDHEPDYVAPSEYQKLVNKHHVRTAVLRTALASKQSLRQPRVKFLAAGIQFAVRDTQKTLMRILDFLERGLNELRAVEKFRAQEKSKRWQAHYDLLMGQMLVKRVRLNNSIPLLNEMYTKPKVCPDRTTNAWELTGVEGTALAQMGGAPQADHEERPESTKKGQRIKDRRKKNRGKQKTTASANADLELARKYLERVVNEHPGTPWALVAKHELEFPLAFKWHEAFMIPPAGEKLPWDKVPWKQLTKKEKVAKEKFERFQRERRKRKQLQQKRKQGKGAGKKKIPKL